MPYSSNLSNREWEIIEPLLPKKKQTRPPLWSKRQILDGVFYQLKNGCNWCDLPKDLRFKIYHLIQPSSGTTNNGEKRELLTIS